MRLGVVTASLISTSTGAFLLSLMVFAEFKRVSFVMVGKLALVSFVVGSGLFFVTKAFYPDLYLKIFGPLVLVVDGGLSDLKFLALNGYRMKELGEEYQSSFVWRMYAYFLFLDYWGSQSIYNILFGAGYLGFESVWDGIAPHNDFLLVLLDFGLLAFLIVLFLFTRALYLVLKNYTVFTSLLLILIMRLMFENNIYSYYLVSGIVVSCSFIFYSINKLEEEG